MHQPCNHGSLLRQLNPEKGTVSPRWTQTFTDAPWEDRPRD